MPVRMSSFSTIYRPDSAGRCRTRPSSSKAMSATTTSCAGCCRPIPSTPSSISPGRSWCPNSVADPLGYYLNNTCKSRTLIASAVEAKIPHFIFSSTAAVYGMPKENPVAEDALLDADVALRHLQAHDRAHAARHGQGAHDLRYVALRYFNVAGADPLGRSGQSTARATHLIKVACEAALGERPYLEVFGTRLSHAGRHLHPRLYPRDRSRPAPISMRSAISARAERARC